MGSRVLNEATAGALDQLGAGVDALATAGVDPVDARDAITLIEELEVAGINLARSHSAIAFPPRTGGQCSDSLGGVTTDTAAA